VAEDTTSVDDIERQVIDLIARKKKLDPSSITSASTFEALGLDSLDAADLMFTMEDTFHILVPDEAALSMRSVGEVVRGVRQLVAEGTKSADAS